MTRDFSATGFPLNFSQLIAEASMSLPPLTRPEDGDFLRAMAGKAINTFWSEYVDALPQELRADLGVAMEKGENAAVLEWFSQYADFENDAGARQLANLIFDEIALQLPSLIKKEYHSFQQSLAAVA